MEELIETMGGALQPAPAARDRIPNNAHKIGQYDNALREIREWFARHDESIEIHNGSVILHPYLNLTGQLPPAEAGGL